MDEPRVRLAPLLVGLSLVADVGMGLEPGEAARAAVLAARLTADLGLAGPADVYYTTLLQHIGCTAYWGLVDRLGLLQQLGAIPQPEAATA